MILFGVATAVGFSAAVVTASPVAAQEEPAVPEVSVVEVSDAATGAAETFDPNSTEATVVRVRNTLVGIAFACAVGLALFWWHTNPRRRLRVATRRAGQTVMRDD